MGQIQVGIIGTGLAWERLHYPAYQELTDKYRIAAVCDRDRSRAEEWGRRLNLRLERDVFTDFRVMIERDDLQAIDIMVPIAQNHAVAEVVARARKAIILEKPMGATLEQARATLGLPRQYGILMMIAENYRYSEEYNILRQLIEERKVGAPVSFVCQSTSCFPCAMRKNTFAATEWRQHPDYPGGDILDAAIHHLAGLRHLFGGIKYLHAFGVPQADDFSPYAAVTVNMQFIGGLVGIFSYYPSGQEVQKPLIGLRIFCEHGMIYLEDNQCGVINVFANNGHHEIIPFRPMRGYYNELLDFYSAFYGQKEVRVPPEVEIGDVKTVFAILQSISDQDVIAVDPSSRLALV